MNTPLIVLAMKEFVADKAFMQIAPAVRTNVNGYPFITFINKDNVAENIYFSKSASVGLTAGVPITKAMLATYQIGITTNAAGEQRIKLISNSERLDLSSLLD